MRKTTPEEKTEATLITQSEHILPTAPQNRIAHLPGHKDRSPQRLVRFKAEDRSPTVCPLLSQPMTAKTLGMALPLKEAQAPPRLSPRIHTRLSWVVALLELHWSTSWDLCLAQRIWMSRLPPDLTHNIHIHVHVRSTPGLWPFQYFANLLQHPNHTHSL